MFNRFFEDAVLAVSKKHSVNESVSSKLAPLKKALSPNSIESIVVPVEKAVLSCSVAGVDSGFAHKKLSFLDLVLIKTAGVVFHYNKGVLSKSDYFPSAFSFPEPVLLKSGLEEDEQNQSVSLLRLQKEVGCSIEVIKKFKPKYLFIDGSIVPQYQDKPRLGSKVNSDYDSIITLFQRLYSVAQENSCMLVACVEDSRGTRFRQLLQEKILPLSRTGIDVSSLNDFFDAHLLDYYLGEGERTFAFEYTDPVESHAILKDFLPKYSESIFVFYIKSAKFDKPMRVEFICPQKDKLKSSADEISSVVFALSSLHREYSFPSVLIEADLRAGLSEQEINVVYQRLVDRLGSKIRMRRSNRPFG